MKSWASEYVGIEKTKTGGSLDYRNHLGSIPPSDQSDIALPHTYARNRVYKCEAWLEIRESPNLNAENEGRDQRIPAQAHWDC